MDKNSDSELGFDHLSLMFMHCDNRTAIYIANNPVSNERTKHIEVDCHFIKDAMMNKTIVTPFTRSFDQLVNILTKSLSFGIFKSICHKLGMFDI